jgi:two-component system chemotaxis response regulator CheY
MLNCFDFAPIDHRLDEQKKEGYSMKKILSVDDSASVRQMVSFTLRKAGYEVGEACDGRDALVKAGQSKFDMIITDLNMPNLDGIQMIAALRSLQGYAFTPILMLTTESHPEKKDAGRKAGATGWIVKPFNGDQLLAVVQKLVR